MRSNHEKKDIEYHNTIGGEYHNVVVNPRGFPNDLLFRQISKRITPGKSMLDLGCGTGHMLVRFGKKFEEAVGVDHSQKMLESAQTNCREAGINAQFVESDFFEFIEKSDQIWDLVSCVGCLHHLQPQRLAEAAQGIARLVRPGGFLVIAEPVEVDPSTEPSAIKKWNQTAYAKIAQYTQIIDEPDEAPISMDILTAAFLDAGLSTLCTKRGWEIVPKNTPPTWIDKLAIRYFQRKYGANGVVFAALMTKI